MTRHDEVSIKWEGEAIPDAMVQRDYLVAARDVFEQAHAMGLKIPDDGYALTIIHEAAGHCCACEGGAPRAAHGHSEDEMAERRRANHLKNVQKWRVTLLERLIDAYSELPR